MPRLGAIMPKTAEFFSDYPAFRVDVSGVTGGQVRSAVSEFLRAEGLSIATDDDDAEIGTFYLDSRLLGPAWPMLPL